MATAAIHQGSFQSIPSSGSPGLAWLKTFLPILDSLEPEDTKLLPGYLAPSATFTINNSAPQCAEQVLPLLAMRSNGLSRFWHDVHTAWDISKGDVGGRTVMYEATSTTVFKADPEAQEVQVKEFNVVELVRGEDGKLRALELRSYMDPAPVSARAQTIMAKP